MTANMLSGTDFEPGIWLLLLSLAIAVWLLFAAWVMALFIAAKHRPADGPSRPHGGSRKPPASDRMKAPGRATPGTDTSARTSSSYPLGSLSAVKGYRVPPALRNRPTAPGLCIRVTDALGANGEPERSAG